MAIVSKIALISGAAVLGVAALWHFYWALGGRAGLAIAVPSKPAGAGGGPMFVPGPIVTAVVGLLIAGIAALYGAIGLGAFDRTDHRAAANLALAAVGCIFIARAVGDFKTVGFFKLVGDTPFAAADTRYYSPLCLILGVVGIAPAATSYL